MKRKSPDRTYLKRVIDRNFLSQRINDDSFNGCITLFKINKVTDSCVIKYEDKSVCVINNNYKLLQYIPQGENYTLTAFFDEHNKLIQWYFDITYENGIDEDGIPFYDDLYLDIVVLPPLEIHLLDIDELNEALNKKVISKEQHILACNVADRLMDDISNGKIMLMDRYETDLKHMLELIE